MHSNDNYENKKQETEEQKRAERERGQQEDKHNPSTANEVATTITAYSSRLSTRTQPIRILAPN